MVGQAKTHASFGRQFNVVLADEKAPSIALSCEDFTLQAPSSEVRKVKACLLRGQ